MAELTKEQVEMAHKAWLKVYGEPSRNLSPIAEESIRAMAPLLQLPWDEPTLRELVHAYEVFQGPRPNSLKEVLVDFVRQRNANLTPKPVDPRREKVIGEIKHRHMPLEGGTFLTDEEIADRILAALDEVK